MKTIKDLKDIDRTTSEGKLLFAAIAKITSESEINKSPWEVIEQLNTLAERIDTHSLEKQKPLKR